MGLGRYTWWNNPYPDDLNYEPGCAACDDTGCPECGEDCSQCDCCGRLVLNSQIQRCVASGIETFACDKCRYMAEDA